MKNKLKLFGTGIIMLLLIGFYSCTKEDESVDNVVTQSAAVAGLDYGQAHNDIIDSYYNRNDRTTLTLAEKIALVDDYFVQEGITPLFSEMVTQNRDLELFLIDMNDNDHTLTYYANMFDSLHVSGYSTERELAYQLDVIDALVENSEVVNQRAVIDNLRDLAMVEDFLVEASRQRVLGGLDITMDSMDYWTSQGRGVPWYTKDAMGALYAWNSGIAAWACAVTANPAAGAAVVIGVAAVSSMLD